MLAHLVSFENLKSSNPAGMIKAYKEIRKELAKYDKNLKLGTDGLSVKKEIIILTKTDVVSDSKIIAKTVKEFEKIGDKVFVLSLFDDKMVKKLSDDFAKILKPRPSGYGLGKK